jgi:5-methylcytosine-specific restriction enzyme subunit McrC
MSGNHDAFSLLFPMEAVFENFVAQYLSQKVISPQKISAQIQSKSLVSYDGKNYFRLKPDIFLQTGSDNDIIMDTKWKLIDQSKSSGTDKFGLSQNDFYQMLGYGHKYLNGIGELVLIYPKTANFDKPLEHIFKYDDKGNLKLKVVPFDLSHQCSERIDLGYIGIKDQKLREN